MTRIVSESGSSASSSSSKRPRLDQLPAANLDADDPVDDDVSIDTVFMICRSRGDVQLAICSFIESLVQ